MKHFIDINNKKAYHDYFINDTLECGLVLIGNEVKSIKNGNCNIKDSWCQIKNNELIVNGLHISNYNCSNTFDLLDEKRTRTLLVHKKEITRLLNLTKIDGMTLIPLKLYLKDNKVKLLLGICKGKHNYDKRCTLKEKQIQLDIKRQLK